MVHLERKPDIDMFSTALSSWRLVFSLMIGAGTLAVGGSFLLTPVFTAKTSFLPPQQQQNSASAALASLSALSGLGGGIGGSKNTADLYVSLLQSENIEYRIIKANKLGEAYQTDKLELTRRKFERNVRVALGKKDGLITVEVDDTIPQRAADIANQHVQELRRLSMELALTETQQRRVFFEGELKKTQSNLLAAQQRLQGGGLSAGMIKTEPRAAVEAYAKLKAEATAAEVRLRTLRSQLTERAPEVQILTAQLAALNSEVAKIEASSPAGTDTDYIGRLRDFKYQETLFDLLSRQYELARLDESREAALIQVIDVAKPPELKSSPKRTLFAAGGLAAGLLLGVLLVLVRLQRQSSPGEHAANARDAITA